MARLVGYDEIPVTVPPAPVEAKVGLTAEQLRKRQVADELAEYGMVETLSYPFVGDEDYKNFALDADATKKVSVEIANPLAGDRPFLRRDIIPTLAQTVQRNLRRGVENVSLYEIGHVYLWDPNAPAIPALPGGVRPTDEQLAALDAGLPEQPDHVAGILTGLALAYVFRRPRLTCTGTAGVLGDCMVLHGIYNLLITADGFWQMVGYFFPSAIIVTLFAARLLHRGRHTVFR